jgi:hypothetical protein
MLLRDVAVTDDRAQAAAIDGGEGDGDTRAHAPESHGSNRSGIPSWIQSSDLIHSHVRHFKQQAQEFLFSLVELFSSAAAGHGRRHDHQTTVDHALMRGLVTAGPVMRRGASSV